MAGLNETGFVTKRLQEIIADYNTRAKDIFQDLVPPGEELNTGPNSVLGRWIGLISPADADIWEALLEVYSAFDPNTATGVALDNIVMYAGLTRKPATASTATVIVTGNASMLIPDGMIVSSPTTGKRWLIASPIQFGTQNVSGVGVNVTQVQNSAQYKITYVALNGNTTEVVVTSGASATNTSIMEAFVTQITSNHADLKAYIEDGVLYVMKADPFQVATFSTSNNLGITKVTKMGNVKCEETGPVAQNVNTITNIVTPILGWDSVYNPTIATVGRHKETDEELRERFRNSKFEKASNIIESLYSALIGIPEVTQLRIYENDGDVTDENGLPPHSFMPIIVGGVSSTIAQTIWENKPVGILSYGNTQVNILDSQGIGHLISFERPAPVEIYIKLELVVDSGFPSDGATRIKQALIDYFAANYTIGEDIIYSRLYSPINSVPGHFVDSLTIGTAEDTTATTNIAIPFNKIYSLQPENIEVTVA